MTLDKAIEVYNELYTNEIIKQFNEARNIIVEKINKQKPKSFYYKSSTKYDYYVEEPYSKIQITKQGAVYKDCGFDGFALKHGGGSLHFCLAYCNYTKEKVIDIIEKHIREDNND